MKTYFFLPYEICLYLNNYIIVQNNKIFNLISNKTILLFIVIIKCKICLQKVKILFKDIGLQWKVFFLKLKIF